MLEMIALILQGVERFVLNLPASPSGPHHVLDGALGERQIGAPVPARDRAFFVGLFVPEKIDRDINRPVIQAQPTRPAIDVPDALRVGFAPLFDLPPRQASGELLEQTSVRVGLDVEDEFPAVAADLAHLRGVGIQRIWLFAGKRACDLIEAAQIALFRHGLLFEVEQRGTFERKHGEGAFQDIRQDILRGSAAAVIGDLRKGCTQHRQQFIKRKLLLPLQFFF